MPISKQSIALLCVVGSLQPASAQLRIVSYNTAQDASESLGVVLPALGEELRNGFAKPIDILALQEQRPLTDTTQGILDLLNGYYGPGTYARGSLMAETNGSGIVAVVYNTESVELIGEHAVSDLSTSGAARETLRYQFRPVGYDSEADFYLYNSHYKASPGSANETRRNVEALQVRADADALGDGAHLIFAGDFNLYGGDEPAYQTLLSSGDGQAHDPLNPTGAALEWNDNSFFAGYHTQSPCAESVGACGVGGGMNSRFDFQLHSGELRDEEGFDYLGGSFHAFGNNGSTFNHDITDGNTAPLPGLTSYDRTTVLNALRAASDHLPVVADYQVPAVLGVELAEIPSEIDLGTRWELPVEVFNAADVVAEIGADELEYQITATGDLSGSFSGVDLALGVGVLHGVTLDASTPGPKSGLITVSTTSPSAANPLLTFPVEYEVTVELFAGDYNLDGRVDAADYTVWRDRGDSDLAYQLWSANYGASFQSTMIPEPATGLITTLLLVAVGTTARRV